ncbi:uncharacterized protein LOC144343764 [Saccoglossus kowalevskii]
MMYWKGAKTSKSQTQESHMKRGPERKVEIKEEMLITLMKLRLGLLNEYIARTFNLSEGLVSSIFTTWVKVIGPLLKESIFLPDPENIRANLPRCFMKRTTRLRDILDCTEFFIERPRELELQALTWSDYKKHNTIKVLVVITPRGKIGFLSEAWGGRTSDRHITQNNGFMDKVESYDQYMADRGFDIAGDLLLHRTELVIPPGARSHEQMSGSDVKKTKEVANLGIHIERAIERIKRFRILKTTLPLTLVHLANDIIMACAGLCNLLDPLIK